MPSELSLLLVQQKQKSHNHPTSLDLVPFSQYFFSFLSNQFKQLDMGSEELQVNLDVCFLGIFFYLNVPSTISMLQMTTILSIYLLLRNLVIDGCENCPLIQTTFYFETKRLYFIIGLSHDSTNVQKKIFSCERVLR